MKGKDTCKILKEIRQKIALENDIALVTDECTYKGECKGTCPKCEAEVRYLEKELERRRRLGKFVTIAGLSLCSLSTGLTSCKSEDGDVAIQPHYYNENVSSQENEMRGVIYNNIIKYTQDLNVPIEDTTITSLLRIGFIVTPNGEITNITVDNNNDEKIDKNVVDTIEQYLHKIPQESLKGLEHNCQYYIRIAKKADEPTYVVWEY